MVLLGKEKQFKSFWPDVFFNDLYEQRSDETAIASFDYFITNDIITVHVPLNSITKMFSKKSFPR